VPAVTHVDGSARPQTVDAARHGRFHTLLEAFARKTGCPLLVNTSLNVRGEPIACSPQDAYGVFTATEMDVLVLERTVLVKSNLPMEERPEVGTHAAGVDPDPRMDIEETRR